jgi:hypothetical protein
MRIDDGDAFVMHDVFIRRLTRVCSGTDVLARVICGQIACVLKSSANVIGFVTARFLIGTVQVDLTIDFDDTFDGCLLAIFVSSMSDCVVSGIYCFFNGYE